MRSTSSKFALVMATAAISFTMAYAQAPAGAPAPPAGAPAAPAQGRAGGGGGGRGGGLPGATPEQTQAVNDMTTALAAPTAAVTTARNELATATFADPRNDAGIRAAVEKLRAAELALATARADAFAKLQAGPNKLSPEQITALVNAGGALPAGRGGAGGARGAVPPGAGAQPPGPAGPGRGN